MIRRGWNKFINEYVKKAWAPTVVVTLIFFAMYFGFGMENTMIAPFATLSFLRFRDMKRRYSCMVKTFGIYVVMAVAAYVALLSVPLCMIVNALALFWICALLIDEYQMNNYFTAGMALIFFQISPVQNWMAVGMRIFALAVSFAIIFSFLILLSLREKDDVLEGLAGEGQQKCYQLYKALEAGTTETADTLREQIAKINQRMSRVIYMANRGAFVMYKSVNMYCRYVALFEAVHYESRSNEEKSVVLAEIEKLLQRIAYLKANEIPDNKKLQFRDGKFDPRVTRYRFAMRQIIIVMPTLVFAYVTGWQNAYWLSISVFFMLVPFYENTKDRVRARVFGTLRGIIFCMVLFFVFRGFPARVVIMTIFNFLIYTANGYETMVSYITCSALALNSIQTGVAGMLFQRVAYTLVGAVITVLANKYVFPVKIKPAIEILKEKLGDIEDKMQHEIPYIEDTSEKWHRVNESVIKAYMLGNTLMGYEESEENHNYLLAYMMNMIRCIKEKIDIPPKNEFSVPIDIDN